MKEWFLTYIRGYKKAQEEPYANIPNVGDICLVNIGDTHELAIFKERIEEERLSKDAFRYYFELIDGCILNIYNGVLWKPTNRKRYEGEK